MSDMAPTRVVPLPDGPYAVSGPLEITRQDGIRSNIPR